jgi:hypothetical protein
VCQDYRLIKPVRQIRSLTRQDMAVYMETDPITISLLEDNLLNFSPLYQGRFSAALQKLNVTETELTSIRTLIKRREET